MQNALQALELEKFLPYRLSVLAQLVSESLHDLYAAPFGLSVTQWRVMAALGRFAPSTQVGTTGLFDSQQLLRELPLLANR